MKQKKEWLSLIIGIAGTMLGLCAVTAFTRLVLMSLPLVARMISMIVVYWFIAIVPVLIIMVKKEKWTDYGFQKERQGTQILVGIILAIAMSCIGTLLPHLLGVGEWVDNGKRYQELWKFIYEFFYCILAIGFVEELVFRGFIFHKIKNISQKDSVAVIGSSVLFGVFHIFGGNPIQLVCTACIGALFCFFKLKIKNCSLLSLIIAHGIYDFLITVWASLLL